MMTDKQKREIHQNYKKFDDLLAKAKDRLYEGSVNEYDTHIAIDFLIGALAALREEFEVFRMESSGLPKDPNHQM